MTAGTNPWLTAGGASSALAAAAHLACIVGGPTWYAALGAPPGYVRAVERGSITPAVVTLAIAGVLALASAYALSGAGLVARLPALKVGLVVVTAVYLGRGAAILFPELLRRPDLSGTFVVWSSLIVLAMGLIHAVGVWRGWTLL